jgi:hypothetical protein
MDRDVGVPVRFEVVGRVDVDTIFAAVREAFPDLFRGFQERALAPFDRSGPASTRTRTELVAAYDEYVAAAGMEAVRAALGDAVPAARLDAATTPVALAALLAELHIETAREVLGRHAGDRERMAWEIWEEYLGGLHGADVVVTNQPIASFAPRVEGVRTALAGGLRAGGVREHPAVPGGFAVLATTFPAGSDAPPIRRGRGGADPADLAGALLAHESAHALRGWGHPEGHAACLMDLPIRFRYEAWLRDLAEQGPCRLPHGASP